jgi:hypothetical protein
MWLDLQVVVSTDAADFLGLRPAAYVFSVDVPVRLGY